MERQYDNDRSIWGRVFPGNGRITNKEQLSNTQNHKIANPMNE